MIDRAHLELLKFVPGIQSDMAGFHLLPWMFLCGSVLKAD